MMFSESQRKIIRFCAEEVKRQQDGPTDVPPMISAWEYAQSEYAKNGRSTLDFYARKIDLEFIKRLGMIVKPGVNANGFRKISVFVGNDEKAPWWSIERSLDALIDAYYTGALDNAAAEAKAQGRWAKYKMWKKAERPEDIFYFEYEEIHPFVDGNGRTGKILYNYLRGTLDDPVLPANFWGHENL